MSAVMIRPIRGFPGYLVGTDGSVWTRWKIRGRKGQRGVESYIGESVAKMKPRDHDGRYWTIALRKDGRYFYFLIHRLVLETFVGPCPEGMECLHADDDGKNNRLRNLRWGTRKENVADMIRHGLFKATEAAAVANRGRKHSPERVAARAAKTRGRKNTPEARQRMVEAWNVRRIKETTRRRAN